MTLQKPFVWLIKNGKYYVELGDTQLGILTRIDNYLGKLTEILEKKKKHLNDTYARQDALKTELARKEDYTDKIEELTKELEKLDCELGADKK